MLEMIVGSARVQAEPDAAALLASQCGGLPLALRIAAARLASRPHWRIGELTDRLANPDSRLDELVLGQLSVRAAFGTSYDSLRNGPGGGDLARAFRILARWAGPITTQLATIAFGVDATAAEAMLETLLDWHLLKAGPPGRYSVPALLRIYSREQSGDEDTSGRDLNLLTTLHL
jgi:hypothetical protein